MNHANTPFPGGVDTTLLERILWNQIVRLVHQTPPAWNRGAPSARVIREVLQRPTLDPDELVIVQMWEPVRETARALFDQLLQMRVNRAARDGLGVEADRLGIPRPDPPQIAVVRSGDREAPGGRRTAIELLKGTQIVDIAELEPGEHLDELVDLLVLANQDASQELLSTLKVDVAFHREDQPIDLMVPQTPSVQVFDLERSLAQLEWVLRAAIPEDLRLKIDGGQSFDRDLTGELLGGKYRVKAFMGKGAFKTVYEGVDEMLGARVAIAVLNPKGARSHRALEHFQDEARVLTTLDHENIVRWITFDRTPDKLHYFVMEYLDGEELEKILRRDGRLPPKRVAQILLQVLSALRRAHALGKRGRLLHLDLKPENVFVLPSLVPGDPERVKVIDFGIGQHVGAEVRAAERPQMSSIYDLPTEELGKSIGSMMLPEDESGVPGRVQRARGGTLLYASPEQCKHLAGHRDIVELDGRSDLYSLGVMAFRMLTGQFPFAKCDSAYEAIENHLSVPPRKVGSLGIKVPRKLAAFVDKCLIKNRDKRWKGANEAYAFLEGYVRPRVSPLKVVLPIVVIGAAGIGAVVTNWPEEIEIPLAVYAGTRPVETEYFGPDQTEKELRLPDWGSSNETFELQLVRRSDGRQLQGWRVLPIDHTDRIRIRALQTDVGEVEVKLILTTKTGKVHHSSFFNLDFLGRLEIEKVAVAGADPQKEIIDPRGRRLSLTVKADPQGRSRIRQIEILRPFYESVDAGHPFIEKDLARYEGPDLGSLYDENVGEHPVKVSVRVIDLADQADEYELPLRIAGSPVSFAPDTGFVGSPESDSLLYSNKQALLPGNALCVATTGSARVQVFLGKSPTALFDRKFLFPDKKKLIIELPELGINQSDISDNTLRIRIDDDFWVDRVSPSLGQEVPLGFSFTAKPPQVDAEIDGRSLDEYDFTSIRALEETRLLVTSRRDLWIEAAVHLEGSPESPSQRLQYIGGSFELRPSFPIEGRYRIIIRKHILETGDAQGPLIPPEHVYLVEVDRTKPIIDFQIDGPNKEVRADGCWFCNSIPERLLVTVSESVRRKELHWKLFYQGDELKRNDLGNGAEFDISDELPSNPMDGLYELTLDAIDDAGNEAPPLTERWQVARTGPEVHVDWPYAQEGFWSIDPKKKWNISVRADDPNGIKNVIARVTFDGDKPQSLSLQKTADGPWELPEALRSDVDPWNQGKRLTLEVIAYDKAGLEGKTDPQSAIVPESFDTTPIVIAHADRPSEIMIQVRVPKDLDYTFGGRDEEDDATSGIQKRCWGVKLRQTNDQLPLRSYYLDASEVTRNQFQEFVLAPNGYINEKWWPIGSKPERKLLDEWQKKLQDNPDAAVTSVSWPEAFAYARWRGKRLPNMFEWEFAIRGEQYLCEPSEARPPAAPESWPLSLWTGPCEWTATEYRSFQEFRNSPELLFRDTPSVLEATIHQAGVFTEASDSMKPTAELHWTVGSPIGKDPSWADKGVQPDAEGSRHDEQGFRCALDQETAHRLLKDKVFVRK